MFYFAYGSNMLQARIEERLGPCHRVGTAWLTEHMLRFHKDGRDGSGKCDIALTGDTLDRVYGVVFEIRTEQKRRLDVFEGADYSTYQVRVRNEAGILEAFAYRALGHAVNPNAVPFTWYKTLVLAGARNAGFPDPYIAAIRAVEAVPDPNGQRHARHLSLLDALAGKSTLSDGREESP